MNVHQSALADEKPNGHSLTEFCDLQRAGLHPPDSVIKRDGRVAPFDIRHIEHALNRCFSSLGRAPQTPVSQIARNVVNILSAKMSGTSPTVEDVQDIVEMVLQAAGEFDAAKHYILYRAEHAKKREERPIPLDVRQSFLDSDRYFPTPLQKFQFFDKYSRFNYELGRRETWIETVNRSVDFLYELAGSRLPHETYERVRQGILEMRAMPSMRLLAMAGAAARRNNITIYNCSYQPVESLESFVEALTISMSGCGVGFSVESHYVENFPRIKRQRGVKPDTYVVDDSAEGWADALRYGLEQWFDGGDVRFDISQLRQAGAPLKTKGGRASGPEPLRLMLKFVRSRLLARQGSFLRPLDAHDIMCAVGNAAVSGGMRRTAMVSLFDYDDSEMQECKNGDFERENSQRWNANNSAVWPEGGLTQMEFMKRFLEMIESERGEPGIFNREAAKMMRPERRIPADFGTNPCVTGDTWVAVADGRGRVQMRELVEHGADVPVFTVKDGALDGALDGTLVIRTMRRPRKTGSNTPIYRVAFVDGSSIRVTPNHTFILTDGSEKCALDLQPNDAITSLNVVSNVVSKGTKARKVDYDAAESYRVLRYRDFSEAEAQFISRHRHDDIHRAPQANGVTDLPTVIRNGEIYVVRTCEVCGKSFEVRLERREQAVCSNACSTKMAQKTCFPHRPHRPHRPYHPHSDQHDLYAPSATHIRLYNDLVVALGRHPMQTEWATFCAQRGISVNIPSLPTPPANDGPHTPLTCWHDLQERAAVANHRVVAVEPDGCEDVYTGTVDETHTFFAIGSETLDHDGKQVMGYVLNRQCGEIILRPWELCNLSSAIARADDTEETLREKVEIATIIGSIQSLATYFPGLRPQWKTNCDEERLLGVDITGQMDSPIAQDPRIKAELRQHVVEVNRQVAQSLGINQSAATTCVKPSGNCRPWYSLTSTTNGLLTLQERFGDHPEDATMG